MEVAIPMKELILKPAVIGLKTLSRYYMFCHNFGEETNFRFCQWILPLLCVLFFKVRKPYTVTKQREKWSEEEHDRFLEAIKLYGRGWRQIQGII
jgi:hypothetical protein